MHLLAFWWRHRSRTGRHPARRSRESKLTPDSVSLCVFTSNTIVPLRPEWTSGTEESVIGWLLLLGHTHLSSIGGGENPHGAAALLHVPEEPESRHLVGLRGHVDVDKQSGKLTSGAWDKGRRGGV